MAFFGDETLLPGLYIKKSDISNIYIMINNSIKIVYKFCRIRIVEKYYFRWFSDYILWLEYA